MFPCSLTTALQQTSVSFSIIAPFFFLPHTAFHQPHITLLGISNLFLLSLFILLISLLVFCLLVHFLNCATLPPLAHFVSPWRLSVFASHCSCVFFYFAPHSLRRCLPLFSSAFFCFCRYYLNFCFLLFIAFIIPHQLSVVQLIPLAVFEQLKHPLTTNVKETGVVRFGPALGAWMIWLSKSWHIEGHQRAQVSLWVEWKCYQAVAGGSNS